jgi:stringent starvation protein B
MSQTQPLPPKKEVALALLERSSVFVHLDPRQTTVIVPLWFKKQPQLVLQVGLNMSVRIPDLRVDEDGMTCTLSFNRTPFYCVVPWSSVFAMIDDDGRGMVWPDDVPAEVARQAQGRPPEGPAAVDVPKAAAVGEEAKRDNTTKPKRSRKRPALAAVPEGEEAPTEAAPAPPAPAPVEPPVSRPAVAPAPAGLRPVEGSAPRRKRELPPYLRVVK